MAPPMTIAPKKSDPNTFRNENGLILRLQCFIIVRDAQRRVACVKLKNPPGWSLPGETITPNEDINAAAKRVSTMWFGEDLHAKLVDATTYPDDGDGRWYVLFLYEASPPKGGLKVLEDTEEITFVPAGKAPGPFLMSHAEVFERIPP